MMMIIIISALVSYMTSLYMVELIFDLQIYHKRITIECRILVFYFTLYIDRLAVIWSKAWAFCSKRCFIGPPVPGTTREKIISVKTGLVLTNEINTKINKTATSTFAILTEIWVNNISWGWKRDTQNRSVIGDIKFC